MKPAKPTAPNGDFPEAGDATSAATIKEIASHVEAIINLLGEDCTREGLVKTPMRAARALHFLTRGYRQNIDEVINGAVFATESNGMVSVDDIEFYSMCEHHILPFFGTISIGYMPSGHVLGISKLGRIVDYHARRLQLQERLTRSVAQEVAREAGTTDVIVMCRAAHMCMRMRGVQKERSETVTVETLGRFATDPSLRMQFFATARGANLLG